MTTCRLNSGIWEINSHFIYLFIFFYRFIEWIIIYNIYAIWEQAFERRRYNFSQLQGANGSWRSSWKWPHWCSWEAGFSLLFFSFSEKFHPLKKLLGNNVSVSYFQFYDGTNCLITVLVSRFSFFRNVSEMV